VDVFTVVSLGIVAAVLLAAVLLASKRSTADILDWRPAEVEEDDPERMVAAQNEIRRRLGKPERTLEEIRSEWHAS
jgi:hypothetical protein